MAQVLLDSSLPQLDHLFDYAIPDHLAEEIRIGHRVRVPLRSQGRKTFGYVVGFLRRSDYAGDLHTIAEIIGVVPLLDPEIARLARAVADRAGGSAGDILRLAIPPRLVRVEQRYLAGRASVPTADAASHTPGAADDSASPEPATLTEESIAREIATPLVAGERIALAAAHGPVRLGTGEWVGGWAVDLARTASAVHAAGRSVIIAAPDYRDVDQLRDVLEALGHAEVIRVDSRQSRADRFAGFLRALEPEPVIVLGNRSAVYAPAWRLGAILLWDDADPLLAEPLSPYVHARDAALVRSEQSGAGVLFGAHARSLDVQRMIDLGFVREHRRPTRRTRVVAADRVGGGGSFGGRVPEFAARALREGLAEGPVLVQVASPGYAPVAVCVDCGDIARCAACRGPIGVASRAAASACRWCGRSAQDWHCATCGGRRLHLRGAGSERTAEQFSAQFPGVRIIRSDGSHPVSRVDSRPALVVATRGAEPIAATGYRAVVLLDIERLLSRETLRAAEDCLRWWENAAALAGPSGVCVLGSGGGPVVDAFARGRTEAWAREELAARRQLRFPPAVRVASATGAADRISRALSTLDGVPDVDVLGPAPIAEGVQRAIVRFPHAQGHEVARRLRGALVADAAGRSARVAGRAPRRAAPAALRLRFDDRGVFDADRSGDSAADDLGD